MGRMNGCAVWTSRSLSLPRSANRHADCDSNRQPDAHVAGNHAEDSSQRGTQGDSYSRISWLAWHNSLLRRFASDFCNPTTARLTAGRTRASAPTRALRFRQLRRFWTLVADGSYLAEQFCHRHARERLEQGWHLRRHLRDVAGDLVHPSNFAISGGDDRDLVDVRQRCGQCLYHFRHACEQLVDDRGLVVFLVGLGFHIHRLRFGLAFLEDDLGFGLALLPDG